MDYYLKGNQYVSIDTLKKGLEVQRGSLDGSEFSSFFYKWEDGEAIALALASVNGWTKVSREEYLETKELGRILDGCHLQRLIWVEQVDGNSFAEMLNKDLRVRGQYDPNDSIMVEIKRPQDVIHLIFTKEQSFLMKDVRISNETITFASLREVHPLYDTGQVVGFIKAVRRVLRSLQIKLRKRAQGFAAIGARSIDGDDEGPVNEPNFEVVIGFTCGPSVLQQFAALGAREIDL